MKRPQDIDVTQIQPDEKDKARMESLRWQGSTFFGNSAPFEGETRKMAKLIKDPEKLVRRTKAVLEEYGRVSYAGYRGGARVPSFKPFDIFCERMREMGFTQAQINQL